jgi:hypothetical protein
VSAGELEALARQRAARQLLHRPRTHSHPADVLRAIAGAQSQEPPAGRLAVRARNPALTAADVERARTEERSVIRIWAMRNTAHLVATEDLPILRPLFGPLMAAFNRRRLAHFGLDANGQERALALVAAELGNGPATRTELSARLAAAGIGMEASHRVHLFPLAVATGIACIGPGDGSATLMVAAEDWLADDPADLPRDKALAELARRYFAAFAPATEADFAGWAGLPLRDVRAGIFAIAGDLREVEIRGGVGFQPRGRSPRPLPADAVRLLPAFDNYLMGHRDREFIAPPGRWKAIGPGGGLLHPAITVGGAAVGTWRLKRPGGKLSAELLPFDGLDGRLRAAVEAELDDIARSRAGRSPGSEPDSARRRRAC